MTVATEEPGTLALQKLPTGAKARGFFEFLGFHGSQLMPSYC